ncbi:MAG: hypothetical protein KAV99_08190 [Candidatus Latescibacteria bacterium]|nr:hypothetical protein [Candidatus Latescibacterota bacterium]
MQQERVKLQIPEEWKKVATEITAGKILILGDVDTGKSTLASFLARRWSNKKLAVIDADLGQSLLGPPVVVSLGHCQPSGELKLVSMRFIGATSPVGHLSATVSAVKNLVDKSAAWGAPITLVNTCGLIRGEKGQWLKQQKINLIQPQYILALHRQEELEHLLSPHQRGEIGIRRLPVPAAIKRKSEDQRRSLREKRFQQYFQEAKLRQFSLQAIRCLLDWSSLESNERCQGLLVGLNNADSDTLALGIIEQFSFQAGAVSVLTPLASPAEVKEIQLGSIRITPCGEEIRNREK